MKNIVSTILCISLLLSCHNTATDIQSQDSTTASATTTDTAKKADTPPTDSFDITKIPISDKPLDSFPYFKLPPGMKYQNKPAQKKYDMIFFPIAGVMTPFYGSVFKTAVVGEKDENDWSQPLFQQYYADSIKAAGGVQVFSGKVSQQELDRIKEKATYFGEEGSLDYWNDPVEVYLIRRQTGGNIWIQFSSNTAQGDIQLLQQKTAAEAMK